MPDGSLSGWARRPACFTPGAKRYGKSNEHNVWLPAISGTFYYLASVLDGYSSLLVHWELRPSITEAEIEVVLQRAREKYPEARPRVISDNGPQFLARDFKEFVRIAGMTHVRTSPAIRNRMGSWSAGINR